MVDNGTRRVGWEKGVDRLADLELMPDMQDSAKGQQSNTNRNTVPVTGKDLVEMNKLSGHTGIKIVQYEDVWEQYKMCLSVWHVSEDLNAGKWVLQNNKAT